MKKQKSCTLSQTTRSLQSNQILPRAWSFVSSSKLSSNNSLSQQTKSLAESCFEKSSSRRNTYKSLESLFDLQKSIQLNFEDYLPVSPVPEKKEAPEEEEDSVSHCGFGCPEDFIKKLKPIFPEVEPHLVLPSSEVLDSLDGKLELTFNGVETFEDSFLLDEEKKESEENEIAKMSDEKSGQVPQGEEATEGVGTASTKGRTTAQNKQNGKSRTVSIKAPSYPMPPDLGHGIAIGDGKHSDSIMSTIPLTDSCVTEEMLRAHERGNIINKEIQELKKIALDLSNKEELSEEDTASLKDTQAAVMAKIAELNEITRKLQRTIGLVDPSTQTFAKMFEMLPYPHRDKKIEETVCKKTCEPPKVCERFAFPEIEYDEDKLPRVIVCGNTEESIPRIAIADSKPKSRGKKCIENLSGKLEESLCLQEKLVKENAQLEGGKCQLEKELQEKDNALECMQRKICGLQTEMRLFMKENTELRRELNCLAQQQQQSRCCSPQSRPATSASSPRSPCLSPKRSDNSHRGNNDLSCKCSTKGQVEAAPVETPPGCETTANPCKEKRPNCRRLSGGASRDGNDCFSQNRQDVHNECGASTGAGRPQKSPPPPSNCEEIICSAEMEEKLNAYGNNTKHLGDQLSCIEMEVKTLQAELCKMQRERMQLEQQRKLLECASPCATCVCCPEPPKVPSTISRDSAACLPCSDLPDCVAQQLRDLREQYARLRDDYKSKLCEVSRLRADSENLRRECREAKEERERLEIKLIDAQERLRAIEGEKNDLLGAKEQLVEQEQALFVSRQRFREAQDELEELRTMIRDQAAQLDDYRNKYLQAQQIVEEQRRQLDLMEMDNARMNENVTLEIGRVKNQFQEKLAELAPLPDILKQTQMKLQECQQLRMLAEHNCEDLSRELLGATEKIDTTQTQINDLQRKIQTLQEERNNGGGVMDELEKKNSELRTDNERLKNAVNRFEEQHACMQKRLDEKQHEIAQLTAMLDQVREDSARQVSRTKERCEAIKRSMQAQISDFEIQLAQCRAMAKTAQKERDEIRQKMQGQIGNLNEALQQAQGRIRSLQGHVDYLKVSYSNVFNVPGQDESGSQRESPTRGYDSCDCNY